MTYFDLSSAITTSTSTVGGLTTIEFSIDNSVFRDFIASAAAQGYFGVGAAGYGLRRRRVAPVAATA